MKKERDPRFIRGSEDQVDVLRAIPFYLCHFAPLLAIWTTVTWTDWVLCISLYFIRMFFITAGYHRYFAHRSFRMGRVMQFIFAFGAMSSAQKGVLWWSGYHRHHHRFSDMEQDIHSPKKGFWWSHVGWILCKKYLKPDFSLIPDFAKYPELRFFEKAPLLPPFILALLCLWIGGWGGLFIGFFLSTVFLWHGTFVINSLAHVFGRRRYKTTDTSRNSLILAMVTLGEGWHNNHHHYPYSANQGFFWWEIDITFYILKAMSWCHLVTDLKKPPQRALQNGWIKAVKDFLPSVEDIKALPGRAVDAAVDAAKEVGQAVADSIPQQPEAKPIS